MPVKHIDTGDMCLLQVYAGGSIIQRRNANRIKHQQVHVAVDAAEDGEIARERRDAFIERVIHPHGDLVLGPGSPTGQGTLVVTGNLTLNGNFNFNGVIMVLGTGAVYRNGGGHGNIYGAMYVAKFPRTGASTDVFQAPIFDTSGGGTSNIQYSSDAVDKAKAVGGHTIKGVREY